MERFEAAVAALEGKTILSPKELNKLVVAFMQDNSNTEGEIIDVVGRYGLLDSLTGEEEQGKVTEGTEVSEVTEPRSNPVDFTTCSYDSSQIDEDVVVDRDHFRASIMVKDKNGDIDKLSIVLERKFEALADEELNLQRNFYLAEEVAHGLSAADAFKKADKEEYKLYDVIVKNLLWLDEKEAAEAAEAAYVDELADSFACCE